MRLLVFSFSAIFALFSTDFCTFHSRIARLCAPNSAATIRMLAYIGSDVLEQFAHIECT